MERLYENSYTYLSIVTFPFLNLLGGFFFVLCVICSCCHSSKYRKWSRWYWNERVGFFLNVYQHQKKRRNLKLDFIYMANKEIASEDGTEMNEKVLFIYLFIVLAISLYERAMYVVQNLGAFYLTQFKGVEYNTAILINK